MKVKLPSQLMHFILIDDDPVSNMLAKNIIKRHLTSAEFTAFTNPIEAVVYLEKIAKPAFVLLDINMPILSGWEALEKIEAFPKQTVDLLKIYIVSSSIDIDDRKRAAAHPLVLGYLEKPISPAQITEHF